MREILFRGKRADNGEWVEGDLLQIKYYNKPIIECKIMPQTPVSSAVPVLPETVGQYTGLTDRNGKRIFEGDIVRAFTRFSEIYVSPVTYHDGTFWFKNWSWTKFLFKFEKIEVIGNIHDNPGLLKGDTE